MGKKTKYMGVTATQELINLIKLLYRLDKLTIFIYFIYYCHTFIISLLQRYK